MDFLYILLAIVLMGWIYYRVQRRIGRDIDLERKEFIEFVKESTTALNECADDVFEKRMTDDEMLKYIEEMWARHRLQKRQNIEKTNVILDQQAIEIAKSRGWYLSGCKTGECYWCNGKDKKGIDWNKSLSEQLP